MSIFFQELKRIFHWKLLILLVPVTFIIYFTFIEFEVKYFPNGRPAGDIDLLTREMVSNYDPANVTAGNLQDFKERHENDISRADEFVKNDQQAQELGLQSYSDLWTGRDDEQIDNYYSGIIHNDNHEAQDLLWRITAGEYIVESAQDFTYFLEVSRNDPIMKERVLEIQDNKEYMSILPAHVLSHFNQYMTQITRLILVSLLIVLAPVFIRDRKQNLLEQQYSSKVGRRFFLIKAAAVLIAAFLIITAWLLIWMSIYLQFDTLVFGEGRVNSYLNSSLFWYNLSFNHYVLIMIVAVYLLCLCFSAWIILVSRLSSMYFTLLAILIPSVILLIVLGQRRIMTNFFNLENWQHFTPTVYLTMIVIAVGILIWMVKREKTIAI
ncbi:ABC transporter permease [Alkalicoccobacillus porphyridii]|uniref:ABC transporter permease n=1 Tax=Alkalicoccobacillus porphyridii TaxID=2597270 RepID=A0A553ZYV0_9BACI|nr:ABC transporter permease [Alkalicoccobacillus porphyridii]TSB46628.1 ABC transporter permease [Alkalicoccobacillus porphyridii]